MRSVRRDFLLLLLLLLLLRRRLHRRRLHRLLSVVESFKKIRVAFFFVQKKRDSALARTQKYERTHSYTFLSFFLSFFLSLCNKNNSGVLNDGTNKMKCTFAKDAFAKDARVVNSGAVVKLTDVVFENTNGGEALVRKFSFVNENGSPEFKTPGAGGKTVPGVVNSRRSQPIASLNPYQPQWTIKAKLVVKQNTRTYRNARGEGRF